MPIAVSVERESTVQLREGSAAWARFAPPVKLRPSWLVEKRDQVTKAYSSTSCGARYCTSPVYDWPWLSCRPRHCCGNTTEGVRPIISWSPGPPQSGPL